MTEMTKDMKTFVEEQLASVPPHCKTPLQIIEAPEVKTNQFSDFAFTNDRIFHRVVTKFKCYDCGLERVFTIVFEETENMVAPVCLPYWIGESPLGSSVEHELAKQRLPQDLS